MAGVSQIWGDYLTRSPQPYMASKSLQETQRLDIINSVHAEHACIRIQERLANTMTTSEPGPIQELDALHRKITRLEEEKQELRDTLRNYKDRFATVFEHAGDSIFIVDPSSTRILAANTLSEHRFGYTQQELSNLALDQIEILAADNSPNVLAWESSFSGTQVYECHYRRKDGSTVPVEVSSRFSAIGGQPILVNFVRDISYRKRIEGEREQLIAELDAFAHTVAHDLKNPLGIIRGYANLLNGELDRPISDTANDYLEHIEQGIQKMVRLIDELLLFASVRRIENVPSNPLDMGPIVAETLKRLQWLIQEYQAKIILPDSWPVVMGYAAWVEEVWANYISNAIKYGGSPPTVELGATVQADDSVCFWVRDNGDGITPDDLPRLFKQFTRLGDTRVTGHGLGLSIVARIIEKLGGDVSCESAPGSGSTFRFTLPAAHL